jgi:hypothetical protein
MQRDYVNLELPALFELLALYTSKYTHNLKIGSLDDDFKKYEGLILQLQNEIESRRIANEEVFGDSEYMYNSTNREG